MKHFYFQAAHTLFKRFAILVAGLLLCTQAMAQCPNANFESGNFNNWQGRTGSCCPINTPTNGIVAGRHTIMTGPGTDPNTCGNVTVVAPGSTFSARLGNANTGSQAERLLYNFNVTPQSNLIIYKYAVVLENPSLHSIAEQPRFEVRVRDQNNNVIPCTYYQVAASSNIPGFQNCGGVVYKDWTTVGVDVSAYIGQNVTLDFATGDCSLGAHFGYAYIDAECSPLQIDSRYCLGSNQAQLDAPVGFASYLWSTGQTTPSIIVNNPTQGQVVSCTITSVTGCQATLFATLNPTNPNPAFNIVNNCMGGATFNNTSTVINGTVGGYIWNFGDGSPTDTTTNPIHQYNAPGQYNVSLTVTTDLGCTDVITQPINIFPTPTAAFAVNNVCDGQTVNVTDQSVIQQGTINTWHWDLGDGTTTTTQNGSHVYADTGTYAIELIVSQNGQCPDTITQNVIVKENPIASFTTTSVCEGLPSPLTNTSTTYWGNITWNWDMDENGVTSNLQNPTYTYTNPGTFNPTLIVTQTNGTHTCSDTVTVPVSIYAVPVAAFTSDQYLCLGEATVFTNQSTVTPNEALTYSWNFGDNTATSALTSPTHTYANYGTYTTELIVSTANNCADTISAPQNIYAIPVAGVLPDVTDGCEQLTVNYLGQSTVALGNIIGWDWDLGNGTTSNIENPTVTYPNGTYNVTLIVESGDANNSCYDTSQFVIKSFAVPVAAFTSDQYLCLGDQTVFTNQSTVSTNEQLNYTWDFGDNTATSALTDPTHLYTGFGAYTAQLIVTTNNGCADTVSAPQNIYAIPVAGIIPDNASGCEALTVNFTGQGNVGLGVITAYNWTLGNGSTSVLQNPTTVYPTANTYNVSLIVEAGDANNYCYDTTTTTITVYPVPVADFTTVNACLGDPVQFNNLSTVSSGLIQTYAWDFGNNLGFSAQANPAYTYPVEGQYSVTLDITTDHGCTDTITKQLDIYPPPIVDFASDINSGCSPLTVSFADLTTLSNGNIVQWVWDFGDQTTANDQNPIHTYANPGTYTVTLTVTTNFGCTDVFTFVNMITVYPNPVAAFTAMPNPTTEMDPFIQIDNQSTGATVYNWDLGYNNLTSTEDEPRVTYDTYGNYTIQLYVENQWGCSDTTSETIIITPTFTFYIPNAFTPDNDGTNDWFFGTGTNIKTYEMYIFNRWGEMIFKSYDMNTKWSGKLGKEKVQDEVYVYLFKITDIFDQPHTYRGSVTMIR